MAKSAAATATAQKMSVEQFTLKAIPALRDAGGKYKGIHTVYSGFNAAFRNYFGENTDPVKSVNELVKAGKIEMSFARGGAVIYLPGEGPNKGDAAKAKADSALNKILG